MQLEHCAIISDNINRILRKQHKSDADLSSHVLALFNGT